MDCAAASARGLAHLARLGELRDQEEVFRAASEARIQAVQRERDVAWEKATYLETRLAEAQEHARHAERLADDIRYSTVWRLSAPLRMVVEKIPILHFSLKRCRAMARIIIHGR
jgi:hypothetical protein